MRLGWLASGNGNLLKVASEHHKISAIISDRVCSSAQWGVSQEIPSFVVARKDSSREGFSGKVMRLLDANRIDYAFLTFGSLLSGEILNRYENRLINFHPAPLPYFPGIGVLAKSFSAKMGGFTFHFVDETVDGGPNILNAIYPIVEETQEEYGKNMFDMAAAQIPRILKWLNTR